MENWQAVSGWVGLYEVSTEGRVRSLDRIVNGRWGPTLYLGRVLKPAWTTGYAQVQFTESGRRACYYIHDLVLLAFRGPKPVGQEVCHGPAGPASNSLSNLRYDTRSENQKDSYRFGARRK